MLRNLEGQKIPQVVFKTRQGHEWVDVSSDELFKDRTVVVFSLPGAFTPTCSSSHVPRYNQLTPALKQQGVDEVVMGMLVEKQDLGFGERSWRYSMLVRNGVIEKMFIEPDLPGDPFEVSDAETMLHYVAPQAELPLDVTVFSREGCPFCVRAKGLLRDAGIEFDELVLNRDFAESTIRAVSGRSTVPQVFINGSLIGGSVELETYLSSSQAA
jgi:glutaredoxin-like protein